MVNDADNNFQPWERLSGEPHLWWCRFERFRLLGTRRSLLALYRCELRDKGREGQAERAVSAPSAWRDAADRWNWRDRAERWDDAELQRQESELRKLRDLARYEAIVGDVEAARLLHREAFALVGDTAGWSASIDTLHDAAELVERDNAEPVERRTTCRRDRSAVLTAAAKLLDQASMLWRRAAGLPVTFSSAPASATVQEDAPEGDDSDTQRLATAVGVLAFDADGNLHWEDEQSND